ncbi:hypothetical protein Tco_1167551, partial [Tanacetum coccineum]
VKQDGNSIAEKHLSSEDSIELDSSKMKSWQPMQLDLSNVACLIVLHLHELHVAEGENTNDQSS